MRKLESILTDSCNIKTDKSCKKTCCTVETWHPCNVVWTCLLNTCETFIDFFFFSLSFRVSCVRKKNIDLGCAWKHLFRHVLLVVIGPFSCQNTLPPQKLNCLGKTKQKSKILENPHIEYSCDLEIRWTSNIICCVVRKSWVWFFLVKYMRWWWREMVETVSLQGIEYFDKERLHLFTLNPTCKTRQGCAVGVSCYGHNSTHVWHLFA